MAKLLVFFSAIIQLTASSRLMGRQGCLPYGCLEDLMGSWSTHLVSASADCSSFMSKNAYRTTQATTTYTVTASVIITRSNPLMKKQQNPEYTSTASSDAISPTLPPYATHCNEWSYVSACSCLGILPSTTVMDYAPTTYTTYETIWQYQTSSVSEASTFGSGIASTSIPTTSSSPSFSGSTFERTSASSAESLSLSSWETNSIPASSSWVSPVSMTVTSNLESVSASESWTHSGILSLSESSSFSSSNTGLTYTSQSIISATSESASTAAETQMSSFTTSCNSTSSSSSTLLTLTSLNSTNGLLDTISFQSTFSTSIEASTSSVLPTTSASATVNPTSINCIPLATGRPGYIPNVPQSYEGCIVDPNSQNRNRISLRDPLHHLDVVDEDGVAMALSYHDEELYYSFSKPSDAPCGVYDLTIHPARYGSQFIAIFSSDLVGFTFESSDGQRNAGLPGTFTTTVWSISCNGTLQAGIIGGNEILFRVDKDTNALIAVPQWPNSSTKAKRDLNDDIFRLEATLVAG